MSNVLQIAGYITGIAAALVIIWQVLRWGNALVKGQRSTKKIFNFKFPSKKYRNFPLFLLKNSGEIK